MLCHKVNVHPCVDKHLLQPPIVRESELHGATNAARGKLLDEVGIPAEVPVDEFIPLGLMLYKAPSDGKWVEEERDSFLPFDSSSPFIGNFR
ncbi:4-hydroxy-4-methyl-2-oxoglutarate aldolase (HMG aldolase) [Psidium guajava]|nr:4-hydroxy-4-methyl-2-oxoglutarate aldolase (HMG aldolase) [Psidium guajava]